MSWKKGARQRFVQMPLEVEELRIMQEVLVCKRPYGGCTVKASKDAQQGLASSSSLLDLVI
jgi:hypothetical protein